MITLPHACSMDMLMDDNVGKIIGYFMGHEEFNAVFKCHWPLFVLFRCVSRQACTTHPTVLSPIPLRRPRPTDPSPKATRTMARTLLRMPLPRPLPPTFLLQSHRFDPEIGLRQRSKALPPKVAHIYLA